MDDHNTIHHQKQHHQLKPEETEEAEEALSLSDLPLNVDEPQNNQCHSQSTPEAENDFFGFLNNLDSEMSHAEDIFFCGRLVPWKDQALPGDDHYSRKAPFTGIVQHHRRRCESLSELKIIDRSSSTKTRLVRNCRSLDYRKMARNGSMSFRTPPGFLRALSDKSSEKPGDSSSVLKVSSSSLSSSKPRWYELMFGLVRFPQEMDLQDIKNRQIRKKPATMFQLFENNNDQKSPVNHHQNDRKSSWGLLRVLSCKNHASVPVTASVSYVPQV